jgi:exosome complex RNA-binding protein Rrp4
MRIKYIPDATDLLLSDIDIVFKKKYSVHIFVFIGGGVNSIKTLCAMIDGRPSHVKDAIAYLEKHGAVRVHGDNIHVIDRYAPLTIHLTAVIRETI